MRSRLQYKYKAKTNDNAYNKKISNIDQTLKKEKKMQKHLLNNLTCKSSRAKTVTKKTEINSGLQG